MSLTPARIGILLSGRGSNFQAIAQAIQIGTLQDTEIAVVLSNKASAPGLAIAAGMGLPTEIAKSDPALLEALQAHHVNLVVLAGYMKLLTPVLLDAYAGRILNIHPSLLPAYGGVGMYGERVHQAVLQGKESHSGCSVHLVTEVIDGGQVLGQRQVPVLADDTADTLAARILTQEHQLYPEVLQAFIHSSQFQEALPAHDPKNPCPAR